VAQEKYAEAISLFRKAIETKQQCAGSDGYQLIPDVNLLARALWRNGEKGEAQTTMARCVALQNLANRNPNLNRVTIGGKGRAPDEELTLQAVGNDEWLLYQGDFEAAARGFRAKIEFEEREKQSLDPESMPFWEKLAEAEEGLGNWDAARDAYVRAAEQWDQRLSPGHPRAQWCRTRAAECLPIGVYQR
jgi:tetratricopeptide (TPR) repeat protein